MVMAITSTVLGLAGMLILIKYEVLGLVKIKKLVKKKVIAHMLVVRWIIPIYK
jgi:hypothetical protein